MNRNEITVIIAGDEVLNGFILDTNSRFFASELYEHGYNLSRIVKCRDERETLLDLYREEIQKGHLIIHSGGLGPTVDDLTVDLVCELTGREPVYYEDSEKRVREFFTRKGVSEEEMTTALRQARIPAGAHPLKNTRGLAPGFWLEDIRFLALPGFPVEIDCMWDAVLEILELQQLQRVKTEIIPVWGVGESRLFARLNIPENVNLGVHALPFGCRLFLRSDDKTHEQNTEKLKKDIYTEFAPNIVDDPLRSLIDRLLAENVTISTVESCTGGLMARMITDIPGVSAIYKGSLVAYSNEVKEHFSVSEQTLAKYGAVSIETAREMARVGCRNLKTDICISTTGIAGPGGGSDEKPVGTVFVALADSRVEKVWASKFYYPVGRERFRNITAYTAFLFLYQLFCYSEGSENWRITRLGKKFARNEIGFSL